MKRPHVASLDEVRITREGEYAVIQFADSRISTTNLKLGRNVQRMTDQQILDCFNDCIRAQEQAAAEYEHVAVEIPPGKPQIEYFEKGYQWTPRGDVLRCVISDGGPNNEPIIYIDDRELSWHEFGRLMTTYAGWGMRIVVVPDDELHEEPQIEVREPEKK
jgi:hypothetical protein